MKFIDLPSIDYEPNISVSMIFQRVEKNSHLCRLLRYVISPILLYSSDKQILFDDINLLLFISTTHFHMFYMFSKLLFVFDFLIFNLSELRIFIYRIRMF